MNVKKMKIIFAVVLGIVLLSDFVVHRKHPIFIWDEIPGFSAVFGLISAIVIIVLAKVIAPAVGLVRKDDHHE